MSRIRRTAARLARRLSRRDEFVSAAVSGRYGQVDLAEGRFLGRLVAGLTGPGPIVEVGTLFGWSTRVMALFKDPARELITVDAYVWNPFGLDPDAHHRAAAAALDDAVRDFNVRQVRADKDRFFADYPGPPPALVFLDADHTFEATAADIAWARRAGAGVVALHDYAPHSPGVVRAVDEAGGPAEVVGTVAVLRRA